MLFISDKIVYKFIERKISVYDFGNESKSDFYRLKEGKLKYLFILRSGRYSSVCKTSLSFIYTPANFQKFRKSQL